MQISASIFYPSFISHHSALSRGSLLSNEIIGIMLCLWKSPRTGEEVWKGRLNPISYSLISTLGTKHKLRVTIASAQVPNTQQRGQKAHCVCGCALYYQLQMLKFAANMGPFSMTRTFSMSGWEFVNCSNGILILCFWTSREHRRSAWEVQSLLTFWQMWVQSWFYRLKLSKDSKDSKDYPSPGAWFF